MYVRNQPHPMGLQKASKVTVWKETLFPLDEESVSGIVEALTNRKFVGQVVINFNQKPASVVLREKDYSG